MSNKTGSGFGNFYRRVSGKLLGIVTKPEVLGEIPDTLRLLSAEQHADGQLLSSHLQTDQLSTSVIQRNASNRPVCYVLSEHSKSTALLIDSEARRRNLIAPFDPITGSYFDESASILYLKNSSDNPFRVPSDSESPRLVRLINTLTQHLDLDVELVPITVLWGRAPDKEDSIFKLLFADTWSAPSTLKQSVNIAIHGRQSFFEFHKPISLRELIAQTSSKNDNTNTIAGHIIQHLSDYLTRQREAVLGPDLSDRRIMVENIINSPAVTAAIDREISRSKKLPNDIRLEARGFLDEIASDYTHSAVRFFERTLTWLWTQLYDGVEVHHFQSIRNIADEYELVYTPSHRSHVDYLLMSYVIYKRGMTVPYIAAGDNLNIPGVGLLLRRAGAFFIRRTFKGSPLYVSVFKEYLHSILTRNHPIEYFIEGGRSRTGRLLPPKTGMLAMTIHSHMRASGKPIAFIPTYFGYERLMEGGTYVGEMSGKPKESESIWGIIKTLRKIERIFGKVHVSFGEPIFLDPIIKAHGADKIKVIDNDEPLSPEARLVVDDVAEKIMQNINRAAVLNPVTLLSLVLLATPKHALDEETCIKQLDTYRSLAQAAPYDDRIEITTLSGREMIAYGLKLKLIKRVNHLLGDMITIEEGQGILLTYFRNNILHMFIMPSLIASLVQHNGRISREEIISVTKTLYPFLQAELFLKWDTNMLEGLIDQQLEALIAAELVLDDGSNTLYSPQPNSESYNQLSVLAAPVQQSLERYFMTITLLVQQGSGRISTRQVEDLCHLLGQRLGVLYEFNSPEFFDKALFRSFVTELTALKYITIHEGLINFDHRLVNMAQDARLVLNAETLKALQHMTNVTEEEVQTAIAGLAKKKERRPRAKK
jgi:glycerol-3-phosphate O-acyltransferase